MDFHIGTEPVRGTFGDMGFLALSGFDVLHRTARGETAPPPIHHLMGLRPTEVGLGQTTFTLPVTRWLEDSFGIIHAGVFPMVADAALSSALYTGMPPGRMVSTTVLTMSYVRPVTRQATNINASAQSAHIGREVGISECRVEDDLGRLLAYGSTRCVFRDRPFDADAEPMSPPEPIEDPPDPYLRPVGDDQYHDYSAIEDLEPMEITKRTIAGELPNGPRYGFTGLSPVEIEEGRFVGTALASPWLSAGTPFMYGGALAWVCDSMLGGAVWSTLAAGEAFATLDIEVRFLRAVPVDGSTLTAEAKIIHKGRSIRVGEVEVRDAEGRLAVMASGSAMVLPGGIRELYRGRLPDEIVGY